MDCRLTRDIVSVVTVALLPAMGEAKFEKILEFENGCK